MVFYLTLPEHRDLVADMEEGCDRLSRMLAVGDLELHITEDMLKKFFDPYGHILVRLCTVITDCWCNLLFIF